MEILYKLYDYLKEDDARTQRIFVRGNIVMGILLLYGLAMCVYAYIHAGPL